LVIVVESEMVLHAWQFGKRTSWRGLPHIIPMRKGGRGGGGGGLLEREVGLEVEGEGREEAGGVGRGGGSGRGVVWLIRGRGGGRKARGGGRRPLEEGGGRGGMFDSVEVNSQVLSCELVIFGIRSEVLTDKVQMVFVGRGSDTLLAVAFILMKYVQRKV
jgi:hypothetical protein